MIRKALFASFVTICAAGNGAQATDSGPRLVNAGGDLEVVHGPGSANVVGGAHAAIAGGGDNMSYGVAPGARTQEPGPAAALSGGGDEARLVYEQQVAPAPTRLADARRR